MSEISNKTLVGLLVVAIVISLAGTFLSLNKLGQLGSITGFQANVTTRTGTTSVTVLGTAQITMYNATMAFGSGQINGSFTAGHDFCYLESKSNQNSEGNDFTGVGGVTGGANASPCMGFNIPYSFIIENTGNSNFATVNLTSTGGAEAFKANFSSQVTNGSWYYRVFEEAAAACASLESTYTPVNASTGAGTVCTTFTASPSTSDAFLVQMNLTLPEDAPARSWTDTVTFTGNV